MTLWDSDFERDHDDVYDLAAARADLDRKRARERRALTEPGDADEHRIAAVSGYGFVGPGRPGSVSAHPLRDLAVTLAELQWPNSTASIARTPLGDRLRGREAQ